MNLFQTTHELGWLNAALYFFARILERTTGAWARLVKYHFVAQPVSERSLLPPGRGGSIEIRPVVQGDSIAQSFPRPASVIRERFEGGAECYAAYKQGSLVGYLWLMRGPYMEDEVRSRFVPQPQGTTVWDFDVYVDPRERLGFAFARLWDEVNRVLRNDRIAWTISRISAFNGASLAAHTRLGATRVGSAVYLCLGPWQLTLTTVAPFFHFSPNARSVPILHISANRAAANKSDQP